MTLPIPSIHEIHLGLLPDDAPWQAWVTVDGKGYRAEGHSRDEAFHNLRAVVPYGKVDFARCYET